MLLSLIAHAPTAATRQAAFPASTDRLDAAGERAAVAERGAIRRVDLALTSPAEAARQTAAALGLDARAEPALREWDAGDWGGRTLEEVAGAEPEAVGAWLNDPAAAPPGGETLHALLARVSGWLDGLHGPERVVAVTHAAVLRAAVLAALGAPAAGFWRLEAGPLARLRLRGDRGRWTLLRLEQRPIEPKGLDRSRSL